MPCLPPSLKYRLRNLTLYAKLLVVANQLGTKTGTEVGQRLQLTLAYLFFCSLTASNLVL
jgi:hypothetical protein